MNALHAASAPAVPINDRTIRRILLATDLASASEAATDQALQLAGVDLMLMPAGIGTGSDLHAGFQRPMQTLDVMRFEITPAHSDVGWTDLAVEDIHGEGGDEENALFRHHGDQFGVFVQVAAVLDGVHTGLDRCPQARSPQGVAHHPPAERMCFIDKRFHLIQIEGGIFGTMAES